MVAGQYDGERQDVADLVLLQVPVEDGPHQGRHEDVLHHRHQQGQVTLDHARAKTMHERNEHRGLNQAVPEYFPPRVVGLLHRLYHDVSSLDDLEEGREYDVGVHDGQIVPPKVSRLVIVVFLS